MSGSAGTDSSTSFGPYLAVFAALLVLTAVTVGVAYVDLGALNTPLALTIAMVKGVLVLWIFMHLRTSERLVWLCAAAGFVWLAVLIAMTLSEIQSRPWL